MKAAGGGGGGERSIRIQTLRMKMRFASLRSAPRDLWYIYVLKFLESYSYFSMAVVCTIFLSDEFGLNDAQAGFAYGLMGTFSSVYGFVIGFVVDKIGIRRSLLLGCSLSLIGRCTLTFCQSPILLAVIMYIFLPAGHCLCIPVMTLAIKGYTTSKNRGFAYGIFYGIMNAGILVSGLVVDFFNMKYPRASMKYALNGTSTAHTFDADGWNLTANRCVFATGTMSTAVMLFVSFFFVENKGSSRFSSQDFNDDSNAKLLPSTDDSWSNSCTRKSLCEDLKEIGTDSSFWRFLGFTAIMINLRSLFRHLDATLPKYMMREFGDQVAKGSIYALNPLTIIFLVPIVSAVTTNIDNFEAIQIACALFVFILSFGEALWSPRLYDYTVSVAPKGKEGAFMALGNAPLFFSTMPVGLLSGYLLQVFCPAQGPRRSKEMWFVIGLITLSSPILLTITKKWIREPEHENELVELHVNGNQSNHSSQPENETQLLKSRGTSGDNAGSS
ncbi:hypothetical protein GUITHDRAFT_159147 [Guillardia theta CCMP2712]|uniref:Major facilitator superfamily (MFS) profile domain-containing protein n=1 Tax=Guillardia theta (strain CCMP2712) TaxID=905079 RepID=L1K2G0_GUITC|nr:hypothetical protein GUITHDRAFT_159147 [Guillardia theta CCMP2712]EKX54645.1 hypothetical protein GUITHDRAFT_159147 [Guillardia theta CCMP2712]|eukprot:XP_005841625.1 hypothetical protein GUITHDRAFT_159147 [Guillardia theta CCMP2712]